MPWAAAAAWTGGHDYDKTRGCRHHHDGRKYPNWDKHCQGDFHDGTWKPRGWRKKTRFRCATACGNKIQYAKGSGGHPCTGASQIKGIPINVTGHDHVRLRGSFSNAPGAFWCHFHDNAGTMQAASRRRQNLAGGQGGNSVYNQLIFGIRVGAYHDGGYCSNINRLRHKVHADGRTCYQMLQGKLGEAAAKVKGIQYCQRHRTDPKCKCINVADSGFIARCKRHSNWAGCKEILQGLKDVQRTGLSSASGLFGNADCLVPGICAGGVFEPNTRITSCANKTAICTQVMKLDNIRAAAGLKAAQACNINFEAEQRKKDAAKNKRAASLRAAAKNKRDREAAAARKRAADARSGRRSPSPSPSGGGSPSGGEQKAPSVAGTRSSLPGPLAKVASRTGLGDRGVAIAGSGILVSCCVMLLVLLLVAGEGGPPVPPPPRRYRG